MTDFIEVNINNIPDFLKNSVIYSNLEKDKENNESLSIPINYYKSDLTINSFKDFVLLLETFRYWTVKEVPYIIYEFVDDNKVLFYDKIDKLCVKFRNILFVKEMEIMIKCKNVVEKAIQEGCLDLVKYCSQKKIRGVLKYEFTNLCIHIAAFKGNMNILYFLNDQGCIIDIDTLNFAVQGGNMECIKYIYNEKNILFNESSVNIAALTGNLEVLHFLIEDHKLLFDSNTIKNTIMKGSLECLKYLLEKVDYLDKEFSEEASLGGHLNCLEYLFEKGCPTDSLTINNAAINGHLDCLRFCLEKGYPRDDFITKNAFENGHLECVKLAIEYGCYRDPVIPVIEEELVKV